MKELSFTYHRQRINIIYILILALASPLTGMASSTVSPIGSVLYIIEPGFNPLGITLINDHVASGYVISNTIDTVTTNFYVGSLITDESPLYMEITGRLDQTPTPYEGDRFDIDLIQTSVAQDNTLTIDTTSIGNTVIGDLPDLSGCTYVIRPHITLKQIFGTGEDAKLNGTDNYQTADKVHFYNNSTQSYVSYWYNRDQTEGVDIDQWSIGSTNADNTVIFPGEGILVERLASEDAIIIVSGNVRTNHFAQSLNYGYSLVSEGRPISSSPASRQMFNTGVGMWKGTSSLGTADRISTWNDIGWGNTYWYAKVSYLNDWLKTATGTSVKYNNIKIMNHEESFFIFKQIATSDYFVPNADPEL